MRSLLCLLLSLIIYESNAQFRFVENREIPVTVSGSRLTRPWEGGINAAQYQKMDLNNDGTEDLIIYHRISGELTTYLAIDNEFVYSPDYAFFFPEAVTDWLILADYNCDGKKDIFTSTSFGVKVFENITTGDLPEWREAAEFLEFNDNINLQVNASDLPGIADIDGDGDLDILAYRFSNSSTIDYFKNMSVETTGSCGSLIFIRESRKWGDLEECDCDDFAFGANTCSSTGGTANFGNDLPNAVQATEHAGGKTILLLDRDNDGDMDLITSDEFCETLYYMENVGTPELARMENFVSFPENNPAGFYIFPSAFYEDVNFDGHKDLIISSNADSNIGNLIDFSFTSSVILNTNTTEAPVFATLISPFLQDEMIEIGETTYPTLADIDEDGDLDMVVGTKGILQDGVLTAGLFLFENTGTRFKPEFTFIDRHYLDLFRTGGYRNIKPQFVDLNGDGNLDLAYQATPINGNRTKLVYRLNQGAFEFGPENEIDISIRETNQYHFSDIDKDGQMDLLINNRLGSLALHINQGDLILGEPITDYAGLTNGFDNLNISVVITDLNNDGNQELITTDITGKLEVFTGTIATDFTPDQSFTAMFESSLVSDLITSQLDEFSPFAAADIFGTGKPALIIGNNRGGISIYQNLSEQGGTASDRAIQLVAFPNPANDRLFLQTDTEGLLEIYTINGQRIQQGVPVSPASQLEVSTINLPAGLYLFRVTNGINKPAFQKVIVSH